MKNLSRRVVSLSLSFAFALFSLVMVTAVTGAQACNMQALSSSPMKMACCMEHKTAGINAPCHCAVKSAPATIPQGVASTSTGDFETNAVETIKTETVVAYHPEPINSQWLALDCRLRAPPPKLYILNCSFLE